jgi:UDP-N-acetyl-D-mannosaminuronate dehydrogenase
MMRPVGKAEIAIVGAGYVGVPLAQTFAEAGRVVLLVDVVEERVAALNRGESHIEEISADALQDLKIAGTMNFSVQERTPGYFMDFHPAPFRRWQVGLVGRTMIGLSDGTSHTFVPGDVRLIEDTTGKGHTTTYLDGLTVTMQITPAEK